jgi:peptide/nickel transport system substrate-binding protein
LGTAGKSHRNTIIAVVVIAVIVVGIAAGYVLMQPAPFTGITMGTTDSVQTTLDPANAYDYFGWEIIQSLSSGLVEYKAGATGAASDIVPALATNWSVSPDGLNYTFTLRQGVHYDNGLLFNATWAKYSIDRGIQLADPDGAFVGIGIGNLASGFQPSPGIINSTIVLGPYTLRIRLNAPYSFFMSLMCGTMFYMVDPEYGGSPPWGSFNATGYWFGNLTKESVYTPGNPRASCPCGLGPYKLTEWVRTGGVDQVMRLDADPNYWNASAGYPKTSSIIIKFYANSADLATAIQSGDVDIAYRQLDAATIQTLSTNTNLKVWSGTGNFIQYLVFQTATYPFNESNIRQAIAACVNRTHIVQAFSGSVIPLYSMIPNGMAYHTNAFKTLGDANYTFANATLKAAGYTPSSPLAVHLWYESSGHYPQSVTLATTLKTDLNKCPYLSVTTSGEDWATYKVDWKAGVFNLWIVGWYPDFIDPDDYIFPFYSTSGASWLADHFSNTTLDGVINDARSTTNTTLRNIYYGQIQNTVLKQCPIVPLYQGGAFAVTKTNIAGVYLDVTTNWRNWLLYRT